MTDAFAIFDLPRRPWLDAAELREEFHRRSATIHPDVGGSADDFAELNAAHQTLGEPVARLRHFLALEAPKVLAQSQPIPPALAGLFMEIGACRLALDAFGKKEAQASSPLARALLAPEKMAMRANVDRLLDSAARCISRALDDLRALDALWETERPAERLAELLYALSFLGKWDSQLRDALLKLDL